jgi:hypothetical protein
MARTHIVTGLAASVGTITIAAALGFAQPDGLEPPAGPVTDTQPSLSSIDAKVDQLLVGSGNPSITEGPWQSFYQQVNSDQLTSIELTSGRTLIHKVIVFGGYCTVFDGAGAVGTSNQNPTANAVSSVNGFGSTAVQTVGIPLNIVEPFEHELGM